MTDLISREALLRDIEQYHVSDGLFQHWVEIQPPVEHTLYGYKIEHLAYIARVMEKTGITAEQAAESFDDIGTAIRLLVEEITQKVDESVREMRRTE